MASENLGKAEFTIRRRVECEERAFHIVNKLVDGCEDEQYLSECGKRISQANYDDIVEERSIIKLCGYPLCYQDLPNVPKKKYHISTKANKVYDISERKKFCSNQCFKASNIFKQQIPESPVWGRDEEKIDIVISPHRGVRGQVGEEVIGEVPKSHLLSELERLEELDNRFRENSKDNKEKLHLDGDDKVKETSLPLSKKKDVASDGGCSVDSINQSQGKLGIGNLGNSGTNESFQNDLEKLHPVSPKSEQMKSRTTLAKPKKSYRDNVTVTNDKGIGEKQSQPSTKLERLQQLLTKQKNVLSGMVDLQMSGDKRAKDDLLQSNDSNEKILSHDLDERQISGKRKVVKKDIQTNNVQSPLHLICQVLKKWISVNSVEYLQFKSSHSDSDDFLTKKFSDLEIQVDCLNLSKNLDIRENQLSSALEDYAGSGVDNAESQNRMKSVPDYHVLKDEADQFQLKVTEFITGKKPKQAIKEKDVGPDGVVCIPTVDAYDQSLIRAKIVLERLDKSLPDLLVPMGLSVQDVSTRIRELIYTFRLERDTITFKPPEWTLVSLLLLKMLSFKVKSVQDAFDKASTVRHFSILLKGINHTVKDIDIFAREILSEATVAFEPS